MNIVGNAHDSLVFGRRIRVLAGHLSKLIPENAQVLDVGCGDGRLAVRLMQLRSDITIEGVDVLVRPDTAIPVTEFNGETIPRYDNSVDTVMLVDVLHHTDDPMFLLAEAARIASRAIVIKDHTRDGILAYTTLKFMDWIGNAHHNVRLPYNYWPEARWRESFAGLGARIESWQARLALYPFPASLIFDRSLHFVARISPEGT